MESQERKITEDRERVSMLLERRSEERTCVCLIPKFVCVCYEACI